MRARIGHLGCNLTVILLLLLALAGSKQASAQAGDVNGALRVIYDVRPPLVTAAGARLGGSIGKLASDALDATGIPFTLQEVPVRRQLNMVEDDHLPVCAVARLKTHERQNKGWFSLALGQSRGYVAVVRQGEPFPQPPGLALWAADPALRWGVQAGLHYSDQIDKLRKSARATVTTFNANHQHIASLLVSRRIDFVVLQVDEASEVLRQSPGIASALRQIELTDLREVEQRYFYCSQSVPVAQREALDAAILQLQKPSRARALPPPRVKP